MKIAWGRENIIGEKNMDIWNSNIRKVKCVRNTGDPMMIRGDNSHLLTVGEEYTVVDVEINSWYTLVMIEEIPGVQFNSVLFEEIVFEQK